MELETKNDFPNQFLTLPEVQTRLGIKSRKTVLKYIRAGELAAIKLGGTRWRISVHDFNRFLSDQRKSSRILLSVKRG